MPQDELLVDLLDPEFYRDGPHRAFTWMRANQPVYRDEANGLWAVTRHADVLDVERRSDVFISRAGYRSWGSPDENNMIAQDDPQHLVQRRLVSGRFTPRSVRDHREWLSATIDYLLEPAAPGGTFDVIDGLAAPLPCRLTAMLLGFPEDRWRDIKSWSERLMRIDTAPVDGDVAMGMFTAIAEFGSLLDQEAEVRRGCPLESAADLLSVWVNAEGPDGTLYGADRLVHETGLFISGGAETTRTVIAHGIRVLADHPDQWNLMAEHPEVVTTAVEELIRWVTPLNNFFRTAVAQDRIGDQEVAAGDRIILLYPSANRDESVFDEPFRFEVTRSPNPHVSFGYGTHFCIGANLARLELNMLFAELTRRFEPPTVLSEPDVEANMFARSVRSFEVGLEPRGIPA